MRWFEKMNNAFFDGLDELYHHTKFGDYMQRCTKLTSRITAAWQYRNTVVFQKRKLDICVSTFEYLYGYATTKRGQFILFGVYRPGSQALSSLFF